MSALWRLFRRPTPALPDIAVQLPTVVVEPQVRGRASGGRPHEPLLPSGPWDRPGLPTFAWVYQDSGGASMVTTCAVPDASQWREAWQPLIEASKVTWQVAQWLCTLPFDVARAQYAQAVRWGLVQRSMLASSEVERLLGTLERLWCGPLARRV